MNRLWSATILISVLLTFALVGLWSCSTTKRNNAMSWTLTEDARALKLDEKLVAQIFRALDAAERAGTDAHLSGFAVRVATTVEHNGQEHVILGGNSEYHLPEAIHGETSLLNHVITLFGPQAARQSIRFLAFYREQCGQSLGCGDCRDYEMTTTDYQNLLIVCGQAKDRIVQVRRFTDAVVPEEKFPLVEPGKIPLAPQELNRLVRAAVEASRGGISLFPTGHHSGAAGLSFRGQIYRAAGADDAAFHYRYPIGGLLQQAATEQDYFMRAIVVAGEEEQWPRVSYRDRQYGYEASSFNRQRGRNPTLLILTNWKGEFRLATFEEALPHAFSTGAFRPQAVEKFLRSHGVQ